MTIDSTLGEGTTVSFVLPLTQDQEIDAQVLAAQAEGDFGDETLEFVDGEQSPQTTASGQAR